LRIRTQTHLALAAAILFGFGAAAPQLSYGQAQPPQPAKKPASAPAGPPAPQSTHYPILLLAFGDDPSWSLRIGLKGPERLDRPNYPPIALDPAEVTHEAAADSWTYHAKDSATGAVVAVHLMREPCAEAATDPTSAPRPAPGKYTFRATVDHAQLGSMKGCARIAAELFPKINNQLDDADDTNKNKPPPPTITNFKPPVDVAFVSEKKVILKRGSVARTVAPEGSQLALSRDGKRLLFTRGEKIGLGTLSLYDWSTAKLTDLPFGSAQQAFWSPDDTRFAFMKWGDKSWHLWIAPAASPEAAVQVYSGDIISIQGWADAHTILVSDFQQLTWVGDDGTVRQTVPGADLYGDIFEIEGADTVRIHPLNPDLLLVAAAWLKPPQGFSLDLHMGKGFGMFLYEIHSKRRTQLSPLNMFAQNAEWSRDGLQIFFTGADTSRQYATYRMFWDGTGLKKYSSGIGFVVGQ
jgi:uncharacterized membrane protein